MTTLPCKPLIVLCLLLVPLIARAEQFERFGPYALHYSVVSTTFLAPEVAERYGIVRGERRAILNLSLLEQLEDGSTRPTAMQATGESWDLMQRKEKLVFREIREGQAIYYIAPLEFIDREWRNFAVEFSPEGSDSRYTFEHKHQLYSD